MYLELIISNIIQIVMYVYFISKVLTLKNNRIYYIIFAFLFVAVGGGIFAILSVNTNLSIVRSFIVIASLISFTILSCKEKLSIKLFWFLIYMIISFFAEFFSMGFELIVMKRSGEDILSNSGVLIQGLIISNVVIFVLYQIAIAIKKRKVIKYSDRHILFFSGMILVIILIYYMVVGMAFKYNMIETVLPGFLMIGVLLLLTTLMYIYMIREAKKEENAKIVETQLSLNESYYKNLKQNYDNIRKIKHDFNNHMQVLQTLKNSKDYTSMGEYIDELCDKMQDEKINE